MPSSTRAPAMFGSFKIPKISSGSYKPAKKEAPITVFETSGPLKSPKILINLKAKTSAKTSTILPEWSIQLHPFFKSLQARFNKTPKKSIQGNPGFTFIQKTLGISPVAEPKTVVFAPKKTISQREYIRKYTSYLVKGHNVPYAMERLLDVKCPIEVYEECGTEKVLEMYREEPELEGLMGLLASKFASLRGKGATEKKDE